MTQMTPESILNRVGEAKELSGTHVFLTVTDDSVLAEVKDHTDDANRMTKEEKALAVLVKNPDFVPNPLKQNMT